MTHRHLRDRWLSLPEAVELMQIHGPLWSIQGPFKYCPICKCVPTTYTGQGEDETTTESRESH